MGLQKRWIFLYKYRHNKKRNKHTYNFNVGIFTFFENVIFLRYFYKTWVHFTGWKLKYIIIHFFNNFPSISILYNIHQFSPEVLLTAPNPWSLPTLLWSPHDLHPLFLCSNFPTHFRFSEATLFIILSWILWLIYSFVFRSLKIILTKPKVLFSSEVVCSSGGHFWYWHMLPKFLL